MMGFVNTTRFPPLGSTLPLFKDDQDQGIIDSGIPPKKGMPVVCSDWLAGNWNKNSVISI